MKVVVAHPGRQHSFQTAIAMKRAGFLDKYITSVYNRKGAITRKLLRLTTGDIKKKMSARRCDELDDDEVVQYNEALVIITLFLNKIPGLNVFTERWNKMVESSFYKKVMKYVKK